MILGVVGTIAGYWWITEKPEREKAERILADLTAQRKALIALGDVNLEEPQSMTLNELPKASSTSFKAGLVPKLNNARMSLRGRGLHISASFLIPFGQEIPPSTVPAALLVVDPLFKDVGSIVVGGVHLREPVDEVKVYCQKRG